ncbi:EF-P beta-lysylation protein EpmB [Aurantivibrio infirmus]
MIPRTVPLWQIQTWQEQLKNVIKDPQELCALLNLDCDQLITTHGQDLNKANQQFILRVPTHFVRRMEIGNLHDPLLLQVLPQAQEIVEHHAYSQDPLEESKAYKAQGIIQKYPGRVLLLAASACAIHCRYCFRRHFPYEEHRPSKAAWEESLATIREDESIKEVIFSGGDPLAANDQHLSWLTEKIAAIDHVDTLRIHTRLPIVIPERIDEHCLKWLNQDRLQVIMVVHCNHANEIDESVGDAIAKVRQLGITVLNQSVLLKGVNDSLDALHTLSKKLFKIGVLPYYLHLLDRVAGTNHFEVPMEQALSLHQDLRNSLPGYLVPRLAQEIPGRSAKQILN